MGLYPYSNLYTYLTNTHPEKGLKMSDEVKEAIEPMGRGVIPAGEDEELEFDLEAHLKEQGVG